MKTLFWCVIALIGYVVLVWTVTCDCLVGNPAYGDWDRLIAVVFGYGGLLMVGMAVWCGGKGGTVKRW